MVIAALFLFTFLESSFAASPSGITVSVLRYSGLKYTEIENLESLYYNFEFCLCSVKFDKRSLPIRSKECECSQQKRGKSVVQSIPSALYPSSCLIQDDSNKCLNIGFSSKPPGKRVFVKVLVGRSVYTVPTWQEITYTKRKSAVTLTSAGTDLKLTYSVVETTERDFEQLPFFKFHGSIIKKALKEMSNSGSKDENWAPTSKPDSTKHSFNDIREVLPLKSVDQVRRFIVDRSRVDRSEPMSFDVASLRNHILNFHNLYRDKHDAPALTYDSGLERAAQRWAENLGNQKNCLVHEKPRVYGENLFFFGARFFASPETMAKAITQSFYLEGNGYNYNSWIPFNYFKTGHFTQLIWQKTRRIGVGVAIRPGSSKRTACMPASKRSFLIYVVVKYDPAGNFQTSHEYKTNVRPPIR
ncbi:unnamed protein product [Caenorhabditis auriculariae]|uniref:SCP domain-containing protein n=1 Tax=Caenorhabditis auriculariae TaxID=2777116 RepID=A0A8S1GQT2_9PELO|nr:unnamed protein product [Caenorhabditis auriculariae]